MQVLCTSYFGGSFAYPSASLVDTGINPDEIDTLKMNGEAKFVNSPIDVKTIKVDETVGMVIDITPIIGVEHIV